MAVHQQNIGTWYGSFTQFSPDGELVKDTPSVLTLEETELGEKMRLTLERSPADAPTDVTRREFSHPGLAPYVYFFEDGSFSQGSPQWAAFGQFGAEMSIKVGGRRVRFVIMYDGSAAGESKIKYVTLIRETQTDGTSLAELAIASEQFLGTWTGDVAMLHANMEPMTAGTSEWQFDKALTLTCHEQVERSAQTLSLVNETEANLSLSGQICLSGDLTYQLMPLPNGAYCLLPRKIQKDCAFRIEVGWLRADGERSRLIRYYDTRGVWTDTALIKDRLVSEL